MPFDPAKPANNSPLSSEEMRDQLNGLQANLTTAIDGTSANSNAVDILSMNADANYDQSQMQAVLMKIDQLILALRR